MAKRASRYCRRLSEESYFGRSLKADPSIPVVGIPPPVYARAMKLALRACTALADLLYLGAFRFHEAFLLRRDIALLTLAGNLRRRVSDFLVINPELRVLLGAIDMNGNHRPSPIFLEEFVRRL